MVCVGVSPVNDWILDSLPFADYVMLSLFHCDIGAVVLPLVLGCCVCKYILGCYWVFLATLGPRTTLKHLVWLELCSPFRLGCHPVVFIFFTELWTTCFTAGMQCLVFGMFRVGLEAGYAWETWCLRATQIESDCWLSSPQPLKSIGKGSQGMRDCEAEKGLVPGVGSVDVL